MFVGATLDSNTVKNWSAQVENYLLKLAEEGLKTHELQKLYDSANYTVEQKSGFDTINSVKSRLGNYFVKKETTARVREKCFYAQNNRKLKVVKPGARRGICYPRFTK